MVLQHYFTAPQSPSLSRQNMFANFCWSVFVFKGNYYPQTIPVKSKRECYRTEMLRSPLKCHSTFDEK